MTAVRSVGIVGAGTMGRGIAELCARAGFAVALHDALPGAADKAVAAIRATLLRNVEKGRLTTEEADAIVVRIGTSEIEEIGAADLVIEAIVESLDAKQALFRRIEKIASRQTILASNTSSLSIGAIAEGFTDPSRFAGLHFFNPPTRMRIVEIVRGGATSAATIEALHDVSEQLGQRPFVVGDTPGFLVNHIGRAFTGESLRLLDEGIASPTTIDRIARDAMHFRMGPFELLDLTGIDVSAEVTDQIWKGFAEEPRFRLAPIARRQVAAGFFGRKTGRGFYVYDESGKAVIEAPPRIEATPAKVRLFGFAEDVAGRIAALFPSRHVATDGDAVALLGPIGGTVAGEARRLGLDPERTVGIDLLFTDLVTLAPAGADQGPVVGVAASLAIAGRDAVIVADGPGMPAQRIAAMMVLVAAGVVERGIATPAEIDAAARLALAYPEGPLELGDRLGAARIVAIAAGLFALTGDPRWRPSPWLSERAARGESLAESLPKAGSAPN